MIVLHTLSWVVVPKVAVGTWLMENSGKKTQVILISWRWAAEKKHACVPIERGQGAMDPDRIFLQLIEKALKSPDPYFTLYLA